MKDYILIIIAFIAFGCKDSSSKKFGFSKDDQIIIDDSLNPKNTSKSEKPTENELIESTTSSEPALSLDPSFPSDSLNQWLKLETTQQEIMDKLGSPDKLGKEELWDAIGFYVQKWEYKSKGIFLEMYSESEGADKKVSSIKLSKPCNYKTSKNIGINSNRGEVIKAYSKNIDKATYKEQQVIAGTVYGGIVFNFKNEKVSSIFIGAMAE